MRVHFIYLCAGYICLRCRLARLQKQKKQVQALSLQVKTLENARKQLLLKLKAATQAQSTPASPARNAKKRKIDSSHQPAPAQALAAQANAAAAPDAKTGSKVAAPSAPPKSATKAKADNAAEVARLSKLSQTLKAKLVRSVVRP